MKTAIQIYNEQDARISEACKNAKKETEERYERWAFTQFAIGAFCGCIDAIVQGERDGIDIDNLAKVLEIGANNIIANL